MTRVRSIVPTPPPALQVSIVNDVHCDICGEQDNCLIINGIYRPLKEHEEESWTLCPECFFSISKEANTLFSQSMPNDWKRWHDPTVWQNA